MAMLRDVGPRAFLAAGGSNFVRDRFHQVPEKVELGDVHSELHQVENSF